MFNQKYMQVETSIRPHFIEKFYRQNNYFFYKRQNAELNGFSQAQNFLSSKFP